MLYLHIGMSKAGSSAIQSALAHHQTGLEQHEIVVPATGALKRFSQGGHQHFRTALERNATATQLWDQLKKEIRSSRHAVLSSEGLWLLDDFAVQRTARFLSECEVKVILYLRNPYDYLVSSYLQKVKARQFTGSIQQHVDRILHHLDYSAIIDRWKQVGDIEPIDYDDVRHCIERDFFTRIGAGDIVVQSERVNATSDRRCLNVLRVANRLIRRLPRGGRQRLSRWVLSKSSLFRWVPEIDVGFEAELPAGHFWKEQNA